MSYKRAWSLVETMNAMFRAPLVESARGGPGGGGAALTDTGRQVLALYRQVEADAAAAAAPAIRSLRELIASRSEESAAVLRAWPGYPAASQAPASTRQN